MADRRAIVTSYTCKVCNRPVEQVATISHVYTSEPLVDLDDERVLHVCPPDAVLAFQCDRTFRRVRKRIRVLYARNRSAPSGSAAGDHDEPPPPET